MLVAPVFGLLGLLVGSFINVVVFRYGTGRSVVGWAGQESACLSCGTRIRWYDNIPVFSWLYLGGRCRACDARISIQYPLVEASVGALFGLYAYRWAESGIGGTLGIVLLLIALASVSLLVAIAVYDLRHTIIPDMWVYSLGALAVLALCLTNTPDSLLVPMLAGPVAALPLFLLWLVSGGRWMGLGDAKLALGIGWLLGPLPGLFAVMYAFMLGAVVSVVFLLLLPRALAWIVPSAARPSYTMKSEVPFGPFLVASFFLVWLAELYSISFPLIYTF